MISTYNFTHIYKASNVNKNIVNIVENNKQPPTTYTLRLWLRMLVGEKRNLVNATSMEVLAIIDEECWMTQQAKSLNVGRMIKEEPCSMVTTMEEVRWVHGGKEKRNER